MRQHNHTYNFALFMVLLSLLFIPVGSFGLADVENNEASTVLSIEDVKETSEASETSESTLTPDLVIPFYR